MLQIFVFISLVLAAAAVVSYFRKQRSIAVKWNVTIPIVAVIGILFTMFSQPLANENINAPALSLFAIPIIEVLLCFIALRFEKAYNILFWLVWLINLAIIGIAVYFAFFFRIQF
jgi:hypothetical protein